MEYIFLATILFVLMIIYFKIANRYHIIDNPDQDDRRAHTIPTLRGGGIIFWFCYLIYFLQNPASNPIFFVGITLVSIVSFIDDIVTVPNILRVIVQFVSIALIFYILNMFSILPLWFVAISFVFFVGVINAYNFMDGINGMTGLYTIAVLTSFLYVQYYMIDFTDIKFIIYPAIAILVFLFFNFRIKAMCFAGDVGSISIAFWMVFLLLQLILKTENLVWILFFLIYGTDTVCTILHRLYLRQNIFNPHRYHYYQLLCNSLKLDHRLVSFLYATLQMIVSAVVIFLYKSGFGFYPYFILMFVFVLIYSTKFIIIKKYNFQNP